LTEQEVKNVLKSLDPGEREMLLILAFNRFGMPGYKVTAISDHIGIRRGEPGLVGRNEAAERGEKLMTLGLATKQEGHWEVEPEVAWPVLWQAFWHPDGYLDQQEIEYFEAGLNHELPYATWGMGKLGNDIILRQFQFAILLGNEGQLKKSLEQIGYHRLNGKSAGQWVREFVGYPMNPRLINQHNGPVRKLLLTSLGMTSLYFLRPHDDLLAPFEELTRPKYSEDIQLAALDMLAQFALMRGDTAAITELMPHIERIDPGKATLLLASVAFWRGDHDYANKQFNAASRSLKARGYFSDLHGFWHSLLLLFTRDFKKVHTYTNKESVMPYALRVIEGVALFQENQFDLARFNIERLPDAHEIGLIMYFFALGRHWSDMELTDSDLESLEDLYQRSLLYGYKTVAIDLAGLLAESADTRTLEQTWQKRAQALIDETGFLPLLPRQPRFEMWERALDGMLALNEVEGSSAASPQVSNRLVWRVNFSRESLQPVEQKILKTGKWSKGRNVALKRLKEEGIAGTTPQDERILRHLHLYTSGWYGHGEYSFDFEKVLPELVGHPLLFLSDNPQLSVELVKVQPELIVEETRKGGFSLSLHPKVNGPGIKLIQETSTRYQLIVVSDSQWQVAQYMGSNKLMVPEKGKERLAKAIGHISRVLRVQSDVAGIEDDLKEIEANLIPHVLLLPIGDDFKVEVFAKPFANEPPYLKPGEGRETLLTEINGERVRTQRHLDQEKKQAKALIKACPTLERHAGHNWEWFLEDTESCLTLLVELDELRKAEQVVIEWPKGETLKLAGKADFGQLSLQVKGKQDWFSVNGEVSLDEGQVMELQQLLGLMRDHPQSQFVQLSEGRFLALTEQLRKHLSELSAMTQVRKGQLGIHPLMADTLSEFSELGSQLKANAAWRKQLTRMEAARKFQPALPRNLQADLRFYQEEGYYWLSRLAHWGVGACLADDMGLGKTVQTLGLLLERASLGPALVVAPASVVRNWLREAEKFAPDLNPIVLSETNRDEAIGSLQPYDLLLVSYTLLQIESDKLNTVAFSSVVLDEAQAIKNRQTKRSKAAKSLNAGFRLLTTGTPIENHLGELWNLFDFINPGLLGSLEHFNERFAAPIEKHQDGERRHQLRKLLRPFILRRRKSEVLAELPEKTEITLSVELSKEEKSFYEALRRDAVDRLSKMDSSHSGEQHLRILAEITRLRQACCHPSLVSPELGLSSSKLALFGEVVEELRANGHKALIFSQFVQYLKLVEAWVQGEGIPYQYLDGKTPMKQRESRVKAFQQGQGDLFLISLKAGGVGLNLTAADYVIHLDPWWNPAVEDQASDRAHRIGQQRPVTVYRLVAEHTIEEKIVRMHSEKRELADSLLEGTDVGGKLNSDDLLALIREG
jgi:hypothetical protein